METSFAKRIGSGDWVLKSILASLILLLAKTVVQGETIPLEQKFQVLPSMKSVEEDEKLSSFILIAMVRK